MTIKSRIAIPRLPAGVWLLSLGQGLGLTAAVISVNVAALAGSALSEGRPGLATVPYGLQFAAALVAGPTGSALMGRVGRAPIFHAAALCGVFAGAVGTLAVMRESFLLLCVAHALLGVFLANVNLFRFASLDLVGANQRPSAMSLVLFGGVFAALLGPLVAREAPELLRTTVFEASYLAIGGCAAAVMAALVFVRLPPAETAVERRAAPLPLSRLFAIPAYVLAVAAGAIGYGIMNLLMIAGSLEMEASGYAFDHVSYAIQWHVFCMFFPSFFSGWLVSRLGIRPFLMLGVVLQISAGLVAITGASYAHFVGSLVLLGLAWNVLYIGGSQLVGASVTGPARFRAQGVNEFLVALASTAGALLAGATLAFAGWSGVNVLGMALVVLLAPGIVAVARLEARRAPDAANGEAAREPMAEAAGRR